jgi:hypothetical protein
MAVDVAEPRLARLKFIEPDTSKGPWGCGYVASPDPKEVINGILLLHDLRPEIFSPSSPYKELTVSRQSNTNLFFNPSITQTT